MARPCTAHKTTQPNDDGQVDKAEARRIALDRIAELRRLSYQELHARFLNNPQCLETPGASGAMYQVETEALWDDRKAGHLRVMVAVDDGRGWSAIVPVTEDFIVAPDGSFLGE